MIPAARAAFNKTAATIILLAAMTKYIHSSADRLYKLCLAQSTV